ncbi:MULTISPECIES: VWA domain-containing protein [Acinetobacter]|uniref:VWA domain-containing protein n=1 Tax=Acinetobacter piscicola TaxID=2006115 RepID=A0A7S7AG93_9GAMM|nr:MULTISPECIES: VWA domain-containing protein [Acinetobacter]QOW45155.1 VWA domain-containing protein [Acinetobacter piscicola]
MSQINQNTQEQERRWRLILGQRPEQSSPEYWSSDDENMFQCLDVLYNTQQQQRGGLGRSSPRIAKWLGDIRQYFPSSVVQIIQKDALERLNLQQMLLEPELLENIEVDIHLVSTLIGLNHLMPDQTKETARIVVRKLVEEIERRLKQSLEQAIQGSVNRSAHTRRPKRIQDINWHRTIQANLKHWQEEYKTIIPEQLHGHPRQRSSLKDIVLCVDQSGSMAPSVVYSSIFAAMMASIRAVTTQMVVFDTQIVDLTPLLEDPVDVLFGTQLGGGTDIAKAIKYCRSKITRPEETIFVLVTDLCEGGSEQQLFKQVAEMLNSGVQIITLLALSDEGTPYYDRENAQKFAALGIPTFACTPDQFPELMAKAIEKQDINAWYAAQQQK